MNILSIDPGLNNTGWSVFRNNKLYKIGIVQTRKNKEKKINKSVDYALRIKQITLNLKRLIIEEKIDMIRMELPIFGGQSSNAIIAMVASATINIVISTIGNLPLELITPRNVKKGFTNNPNADKKEICLKCVDKFAIDVERKQTKSGEHFKFSFQGQKYPLNKFEHIADSIAIYSVLENKPNYCLRQFL